MTIPSTSATKWHLMFAAFCVLGSLLVCGCSRKSEKALGKQFTSASPEKSVDVAALRPKVEAFCGNCHAAPHPDYFPRDAWFTEVKQGYDFYHQSGRSDLKPPPMHDVVAYYRSLAPAELQMPGSAKESADSFLKFSRDVIRLPAASTFPAVSYLLWDRKPLAQDGHLLFCDMQASDLRRVEYSLSKRIDSKTLARIDHPGHVEMCDLDADQVADWVVADLGTFQPADHDRGKVVWLRRANGGGFSTEILIGGLGRVADARPGDFDRDGDQDLVVAEFGWRRTGRILLLEHRGLENGIPKFEMHVLDSRHGTIHVPVVDLDGDGHLDFVALVSQEHEAVDAFLNDGQGRFSKKSIYSAGDPAFGSSGIQVVDLDGDGDMDVLYTNGDTLDSYYLKPYHAVHWLENEGSFPFKHHLVTEFPGVIRALSEDLDGDGDADIVACAHIPESLLRDAVKGPYDSLIWLEQVSPRTFRRHSLERLDQGHMALELGDFNGDSRVDIAVGNFANKPRSESAWLTLWWGEKVDGREARD